MKTLVIYDSRFGNTEKVALTIGRAIGKDTLVSSVNKTKLSDLEDIKLLVVGSPTHGGRSTPAITQFLEKIPNNSLKNVSVAAFDTRISANEQNKWVQILIKAINFASPKIAKTLVQKGGNLVSSAEGFIVEGKEGPLRKGEVERATSWAINISKK